MEKNKIIFNDIEEIVTLNTTQLESPSIRNDDDEENQTRIRGGSNTSQQRPTNPRSDQCHNNNKFMRSKIIQSLLMISNKIDNMGVETTGIDRVPPYERGTMTKQFWQVAGYWIAATGSLSSMSSFLLGPLVFNLTFRETMTSGMVSMLIGCLVAAYCSTMGPQSGCRQMVTARYLFGWWSVKFVALAAILGVLGWSIVNCVVGGEMLAAISHDKVPISVGIVIVTICSFFVAVFGIKQVLRVETLISIPVIITFTLLYISSSDKFEFINKFHNDTLINDATMRGNWLSFFSLCYSITSTWGSITSDYYILFPEETPKYQVFLLTFLGTAIPTLFVGTLGVLLSSIAMSYPPWMDEYEQHGMGGLLWAGFERWNAFGKFCVVILILSLISNNIINTYSAAFSMQLSSVWATRIPRWFWCIVGTMIYFICAIVGRNHFSTILGNFLPMIGYWISMYFILLVEENEIFRRFFLHLYTKEFPPLSASASALDDKPERFNIHTLKRNHQRKTSRYNWDKWDDYDTLTKGYAATFAFLCGVAGVVVGMAQVYWTGPLARKLGDYGGDIAMWLSMGISGLVFPLCRYWELSHYGR
ncbi:vitamin B6 transporter Tpn1p [Monosporozyma servazzii]